MVHLGRCRSARSALRLSAQHARPQSPPVGTTPTPRGLGRLASMQRDAALRGAWCRACTWAPCAAHRALPEAGIGGIRPPRRGWRTARHGACVRRRLSASQHVTTCVRVPRSRTTWWGSAGPRELIAAEVGELVAFALVSEEPRARRRAELPRRRWQWRRDRRASGRAAQQKQLTAGRHPSRKTEKGETPTDTQKREPHPPDSPGSRQRAK